MRSMLKSKIHRATVTEANILYEGSITIDPVLLEAADMLPGEQVHVFDVENGERFITYIMKGKHGSGEIVVNGAAARKVSVGDKVIIVTYTLMDDAAARECQPLIVLVDEANAIKNRYLQTWGE
jgi:aspartate 1-decarboxylase